MNRDQREFALEQQLEGRTITPGQKVKGSRQAGGGEVKAVYNPLTGKEVGKLIVRRLIGQVLGSGPQLLLEQAERWNRVVAAGYLEEIEPRVLRQVGRKFDQLADEVIAFPRSEVKAKVCVRLWEAYWELKLELSIWKYPKEEGRKIEGVLVVQMERQAGHIVPPVEEMLLQCDLEDEFNTDAIPPDATRIMYGLPVTTPTLVSGSGPDGGSTMVDKVVEVSEEQKQAVREQFGKDAPGVGVSPEAQQTAEVIPNVLEVESAPSPNPTSSSNPTPKILARNLNTPINNKGGK